MPEPVLAGATGNYLEREPSESLRAHFVCAWVNVLPEATATVAVVPDGCIDLLWVDGELRVAGPDREVMCESIPPGSTVIGFRFRPGAASAWLRVSASEIVDTRMPLEHFWGSEARRIAEWASAATEPADVARRIETVLARRAQRIAPPSPAAAYVRRALEVTNASETDLAHQLGISERTLRRRCNEDFGYGPKTIQRIARFQRFLALVGQSNRSVAALASDAGYADQAHLTREARRMAALTPVTIREQLARWRGRFVQDVGRHPHPDWARGRHEGLDSALDVRRRTRGMRQTKLL